MGQQPRIKDSAFEAVLNEIRALHPHVKESTIKQVIYAGLRGQAGDYLAKISRIIWECYKKHAFANREHQ